MSGSMRHKRPHFRCGICDLEFEPGDITVYVDDERCHIDCAYDPDLNQQKGGMTALVGCAYTDRERG